MPADSKLFPGQLVSIGGLVKTYAPQAGIVLERHVLEGSPVKAADVIFVVSRERSSASQGAAQEAWRRPDRARVGFEPRELPSRTSHPGVSGFSLERCLFNEAAHRPTIVAGSCPNQVSQPHSGEYSHED